MYICIHYVYRCMYTYIYIYIERERDIITEVRSLAAATTSTRPATAMPRACWTHAYCNARIESRVLGCAVSGLLLLLLLLLLWLVLLTWLVSLILILLSLLCLWYLGHFWLAKHVPHFATSRSSLAISWSHAMYPDPTLATRTWKSARHTILWHITS